MAPEMFVTPRFRRADLVRDAVALLGHPVTSRRLTDWVELGIVPAPRKRGLGRGSGTASGWSDFGHGFWLDMLRKREQGEDIAGLTNYVLALWIYGRVPLELSQVRRALHTWATRRSQARSGHLTKSATITVARYMHPGSTTADRRRLVRLLARISLAPEKSIPPAVRPVVAPGAAGRPGTPQRRTAEALSVELIAQVIGTGRLAAVPWDSAVETELATLRNQIPRATDQETEAAGAVNPFRLGVCRDVAEGIGINTLRELGVLGHARH